MTLLGFHHYQVLFLFVDLTVNSYDSIQFFVSIEPSPAKRRRLSAEAAERRAANLNSLASPSSRSDAGFQRHRASSFYGEARALDHDDSAIAGPSDFDHSGASSDAENSTDPLQCSERFDVSSLITEEQSLADSDKENESDNDIIYIETVIVRRSGKPLIELN